MQNFHFEDVRDQEHPWRIHYLKELYEMLKERLDEPDTNISHKSLPSWENHIDFVNSDPYKFYDMIVFSDDPRHVIGYIYVTYNNEIGIHIKKVHRGNGYGTTALMKMLDAYPFDAFFANINPKNTRSIELFESLGFTLIQQTYKINAQLDVDWPSDEPAS
jgi:RimJ/RimL family protein N-acetyltransferase